MPRPRIGRAGYRTYLYKEKQLRLRTGYGHLPEYLARVVEESVNEQTANWNSAFGQYHNLWRSVVVPVLEAHGVPRLQWALYRSFMNRIVSKVYIKGSQSKDAVIADYVNIFKADPAVLQDIVAALERSLL